MNPKPSSKARTFAWILLLILGSAATLLGLVSSYVAYVGSQNSGIDPHIERLRQITPELARVEQGRRGPAAALACAFGILYCFVAANGFRRGERWAWWAVLCSGGAGSLVILLRVPLIGTPLGMGAGIGFLVITLLAVLIPVKDFFGD